MNEKHSNRYPAPEIASSGDTLIKSVHDGLVNNGFPKIQKAARLMTDASEGMLPWDKRTAQMGYETWIPPYYNVEVRANQLDVPSELLEACLQRMVGQHLVEELGPSYRLQLRTKAEKKALYQQYDEIHQQTVLDPTKPGVPFLRVALDTLRLPFEWESLDEEKNDDRKLTGSNRPIANRLHSRSSTLFSSIHKFGHIGTIRRAENLAKDIFEEVQNEQEEEERRRANAAAAAAAKMERGKAADSKSKSRGWEWAPSETWRSYPTVPFHVELPDPGGELWQPPMEISMPERPLRVKKRPTRHGGYTTEGDHLSAPHRYLMDLRIWQHQAKPRLSIMVDCSGSMAMTTQQIQAILEKVPAAVVAGYSGHHLQTHGILRVFAMKGRMVESHDVESMFKRPWGENVVDGRALRWLMKQPGPRVWVSDQQVSHGSRGLQDCLKVCSRARISIYHNVDALLEAMGTSLD